MNRGAEKRARRAGRTKVRGYEKTLEILRKTKIGPIFPEKDPEALPGMRGVVRRATKRPFGLGRPRRATRPITVECLSCKWSTTKTTWRPAKRELRAHTAKKHAKVAT